MGKRWVVLVLAAASIVAPVRSAGAVGPGEGDLLAATLEARRAHGLGPLSDDPRLRTIARRHTARMMGSGTLHHNDAVAAELDAVTEDWTLVGENVGRGPSIPDIHAALMASPTHKANVLGGFNAIGIGVERDDRGRVWVTQVFAQLTRPAAVLLAAWPTTCLSGVIQAEDGSFVPASFYGC